LAGFCDAQAKLPMDKFHGIDRLDAVGRTTDALVAGLRAVIADLRQDRDAWREQAPRLALPARASRPAEQPMTSWRWLRSAAGWGKVGE
jgi:hypothetical protein